MLFDRSWFSAGLYVAMGFFWLVYPRLAKRERRRVQRGAEANRALAGEE